METKIRVLIADPNEEFSGLLADTLEAEGDIAVVGIAADGMQAISMLAEAKPDVMLLPVNGSDWFRTSRGIIGNLDSNEAAELAARVGTGMFIPGHHDLYNSNGCPDAWIEFSAKKFGAPLKLLKPCEWVEI